MKRIKFTKEFITGPLQGLHVPCTVNTSDPSPWYKVFTQGQERRDLATGNIYRIIEIVETA